MLGLGLTDGKWQRGTVASVCEDLRYGNTLLSTRSRRKMYYHVFGLGDDERRTDATTLCITRHLPCKAEASAHRPAGTACCSLCKGLPGSTTSQWNATMPVLAEVQLPLEGFHPGDFVCSQALFFGWVFLVLFFFFKISNILV